MTQSFYLRMSESCTILVLEKWNGNYWKAILYIYFGWVDYVWIWLDEVLREMITRD